jgi:hypothetical protein
MEDLLSGAEKIDARTLADLLDYFVQLSKQINYYDATLATRDWQPFFRDSLPFMITAMLKFNQGAVGNKINKYRKKFNRRPSKTALQTLVRYEYKTLIRQLNIWYLQIRKSGLIIESTLQNLITKNARDKVKSFIIGANNAARYFHIKSIDFSELIAGDPTSNVWGLVSSDLYKSDKESDFNVPGITRRQRLINLYNSIEDLTTTFVNIIHTATGAAEISLTDSFENLREDLKQRYTPHHALLFAYLKLFQHLQDELNQYTRKHLDFFYQKVLGLIPRDATADHAHIVFDIQKALDTYKLKAGLLIKDSKDNNKEDILFSLDEEIVVNKTQVKDVRTLFVNNQFVQDDAYVQGIYMAPVATKADGIDKDFPDDQPTKSWPTVGSHLSKYIDPENKFVHPYPNARIAFIMASPVLLLNEGTRTIDMKLECRLKQDYCADLTEQAGGNNNCCDDNADTSTAVDSSTGLPSLYDASTLFNDIILLLTGDSASGSPYSTDGVYYYINRDLIAKAVKLGISKDLKEALEKLLTGTKTKSHDPDTICYCDEEIALFEATVTSNEYNTAIPDLAVQTLLLPVFPPQRALNVTFSGEKKWIIPQQPATFKFGSLTADPTPGSTDNLFTLTITSNLGIDDPAVTFYNKDALKEEIDVEMPVVKVELNDKIKLFKYPAPTADESCCFLTPASGKREVSTYHFFRNVLIDDTNITVTVCGLKNFIVQNDESLQDVNKPVYPFGTRPQSGSATTANNGSSFYISSKEVFCKNWQQFQVKFFWKDKPDKLKDYYSGYQDLPTIDQPDFDEINYSCKCAFLEDGTWKPAAPFSKQLFSDTVPAGWSPLCSAPDTASGESGFFFTRSLFSLAPYVSPDVSALRREMLANDTQNYFLKLRLFDPKGIAFHHLRYSYILARQMMALGKLPNQIDNAVYFNPASGKFIIYSASRVIDDIQKSINLNTNVGSKIGTIHSDATHGGVGNPIPMPFADGIRKTLSIANATNPDPPPAKLALTGTVPTETGKIDLLLKDAKATITNTDNLQAVIPNEPWTPIMLRMSIDYTAVASKKDVQLIHLYPYQNTYKKEELQLEPTMFPSFCDEGTLYVGMENVVPGSNVSFLFQLAEATSDTEDDLEEVQWHYLDNNIWKKLRTGFEILEDKSNNLSTSGIVKIMMPGNISNTNTVLPAGLYWIKATIGSNSGIVSETIAIQTQAVRATFTNTAANDKLRLDTPLKASSLSKLNEADASIKLVSQPYDSFGGRIPDSESYFYVRVSELLRHKGRAIQKFDYERLALDICPQVFKAKCINHSFGLNAHRYINDYPMAPGYVLLAVIPDLTKVNASGSFEPRLPLSMLEELEAKLRALTSPFVRLRAMNPRYEKVDFCLRVKLLEGKDENFYKEQLKKDIGFFMAPWAIGSFDKLNFGQVINRSDFIRFLEKQNYIDYITEFRWRHDEDDSSASTGPVDQPEIFPLTPRSILIAGHIDVCILSRDCPDWDKAGTKIYCENKPMKIADYCNDVLK